MGRIEHSQVFNFDAADDTERSVWDALQRAQAGAATADDWQLINWACGFAHQVKTVDKTIECVF